MPNPAERLRGAARRALGRLGQRIAVAFDRLPIRTRLAGVSALLTFLILLSFALVVGSLTIHRIRSDFNHQVAVTAEQLFSRLSSIKLERRDGHTVVRIEPPLEETHSSASVIKVISPRRGVVAETPFKAPSLGIPSEEPADYGGYRVVSHAETLEEGGITVERVIVQYGESLSEVEATVARVELLLVLGVLAGAGLALLAGIVIARRAMDPIAQLTSSAAEIARTRDPSTKLPEPIAEDEVSELSRTLQGMLHELDSAHAETEAMLRRQRQFVADASHELRTPLTSVLANLELLVEALDGEESDAANSALRSSQRMRRLVADLLLLARTDVGRVVRREPLDIAAVAIEAAAELGPVSSTHEISLDVRPALVQAARDEILRVTLNLIENALRHTPKGTEIRVSTGSAPGGRVHLIVEDDGPGVPDALRSSLFERFVRGAGDRGGSFGLGLAIVKAVAESHGGGVSVELTHPHPPGGRAPYGARFTVSFPAAPAPDADAPDSDLHDDGQHHRPPAQPVVHQLR